MEHFGIRYTDDMTGEYSEYVIDSVDLLNSQLAPHGMSFFFDTIDVRQQIIGGKHCWDMFGWGRSKRFGPRFRADLACQRRRGARKL